MGIGNGLGSFSATPYKRVIVLTVSIIIACSTLQALPRRSNKEAFWSDFSSDFADEFHSTAQRALPSIQSHAGPVLFSTFSMEDIEQEDVVAEIERLTQPNFLQALYTTRLNGQAYSDFISSRLQARCLPGELHTIVHIESEFKVRAESRTGARGLWQFADNSMEPWLKASTSYPAWDERFDFWKSTDAAMEKLLQNYAGLDNWLLAIAAYNGGLGRIGRAVAAGTAAGTGTARFWNLREGSISNETVRYIHKYIAASIVSMYPGRFGVPLGWSEALGWKRVAYTGSLSTFAEEHGIPLAAIHAGNAEYLDGIVPPGKHFVKFPSQYGSAVPDHEYNVVAGDTLWNISTRYGLSVHELRALNNLSERNVLRIGMTLQIKPVVLNANVSDNEHVYGSNVIQNSCK